MPSPSSWARCATQRAQKQNMIETLYKAPSKKGIMYINMTYPAERPRVLGDGGYKRVCSEQKFHPVPPDATLLSTAISLNLELINACKKFHVHLCYQLQLVLVIAFFPLLSSRCQARSSCASPVSRCPYGRAASCCSPQ